MEPEPVIYDKIDDEIFEGNWDLALQLTWWLTHLAGGKVVIPTEEKFWLDNNSQEQRLVLRKENGKLVLVAEKRDWAEANFDGMVE